MECKTKSAYDANITPLEIQQQTTVAETTDRADSVESYLMQEAKEELANETKDTVESILMQRNIDKSIFMLEVNEEAANKVKDTVKSDLMQEISECVIDELNVIEDSANKAKNTVKLYLILEADEDAASEEENDGMLNADDDMIPAKTIGRQCEFQDRVTQADTTKPVHKHAKTIDFALPDLNDYAAVEKYFNENIESANTLLKNRNPEAAVEHLRNAVVVCESPEELLFAIRPTLPATAFEALIEKLRAFAMQEVDSDCATEDKSNIAEDYSTEESSQEETLVSEESNEQLAEAEIQLMLQECKSDESNEYTNYLINEMNDYTTAKHIEEGSEDSTNAESEEHIYEQEPQHEEVTVIEIGISEVSDIKDVPEMAYEEQTEHKVVEEFKACPSIELQTLAEVGSNAAIDIDEYIAAENQLLNEMQNELENSDEQAMKENYATNENESIEYKNFNETDQQQTIVCKETMEPESVDAIDEVMKIRTQQTIKENIRKHEFFMQYIREESNVANSSSSIRNMVKGDRHEKEQLIYDLANTLDENCSTPVDRELLPISPQIKFEDLQKQVIDYTFDEIESEKDILAKAINRLTSNIVHKVEGIDAEKNLAELNYTLLKLRALCLESRKQSEQHENVEKIKMELMPIESSSLHVSTAELSELVMQTRSMKDALTVIEDKINGLDKKVDDFGDNLDMCAITREQAVHDMRSLSEIRQKIDAKFSQIEEDIRISKMRLRQRNNNG